MKQKSLAGCFLKKRLLIIAIIVLMLLTTFSGCNTKELFKDLSADYVSISINHKLLSESEDNKQIYTYQIKAEITNDFASPLTNVVISLDIPKKIKCTKEGNKQTISKKLFLSDSTNTYEWIVKAPVLKKDQNIEYSVSVVSDLTSKVKATELLWIDGKNKNDNRLNFKKDTWSFDNYKEIPIPLLESDYNALLVGLNADTKKFLKDVIKENAGGYCYGMAATAVLTKTERLNVSKIDPSANSLHSITKTDKAKSVIGYYWITQLFENVQDEKVNFNKNTISKKLTIIENKAKKVEQGGNPFILSFYTQPNNTGGHAVVGYAHENGLFEWNDTIYDSRILIYDSNYPEFNEKSCLYYKSDTNKWYIPNYPNSSNITRALSNLNIMDLKNIETNSKAVNSYIMARGNEQLNIYSSNGSLLSSVDGATASNNKVVAFRNDGSDETLVIAIPEKKIEKAYTIESASDNSELNLSVKYDNCYLVAQSQEQNSITFNPKGKVALNGVVENFNIEITTNSQHTPLEWETVSVRAKKGTNPTMNIVSDGYVLTGNELSKISVYAESENSANKLSFKTDKNKVLITQTDAKLCVKSDENQDGTYETILAIGKETAPGQEGNAFSTSSLWPSVVLLSTILISVGAVLMVSVFRKKKLNKQ